MPPPTTLAPCPAKTADPASNYHQSLLPGRRWPARAKRGNSGSEEEFGQKSESWYNITDLLTGRISKPRVGLKFSCHHTLPPAFLFRPLRGHLPPGGRDFGILRLPLLFIPNPVEQFCLQFPWAYAIIQTTTQGSYIGYYSSFPSFGGGFDSRTLLHVKNLFCLPRQKRFFYNDIRSLRNG